jgi:translation initiation factor IF-3
MARVKRAVNAQKKRRVVLELGTVESAPKQDGRNMIMVLAPTKKKSEAKAEQRRARSVAAEDAPAPEGGDALEQAAE